MKYAQLIIGLLIGTALGGVVVASQGHAGGSPTINQDEVRQIVLDTIDNEGGRILQAVQKFQQNQQQAQEQEASKVLEDAEVQKMIFEDDSLPVIGNKDGKHVVAEFFDYNCPVCHMQLKVFNEMLKTDKELKIIFHEFPIFGPESDMNTKIGFGVQKFHPNRYFDFHQKMMSGKGHDLDAAKVVGYLKELGLNVKKIQDYAKSPEADEKLNKARDLAAKLNIRGTPTVVVGKKLIPHAVQQQEMESYFAN